MNLINRMNVRILPISIVIKIIKMKQKIFADEIFLWISIGEFVSKENFHLSFSSIEDFNLIIILRGKKNLFPFLHVLQFH